MSKPVILTGLRANAEFHLGNYLGAILPMVELQQKHAGEYQVNMFVPDLHSFTTPVDHDKLYNQIIQNLRMYVASGLDIHNDSTYIYRQSYVPAHSELTWILDCFTGYGELSRMTQFKDKSANNALEIEDAMPKFDEGVDPTPLLSTVDKFLEGARGHHHITAGLFNYPVLMAADILLYGAKYIPVGEDQRQHIELTRDLAERINFKFDKEIFVVPASWDEQLEFAERETGVRIRSLRNPSKKMSKSIEDPSGTILLSDNPVDAAKKIMRAETDSFGEIRFDIQERPGISNLLQIEALLNAKPIQQVTQEWEGKQAYGDLKKVVAQTVENFLEQIQTKLSEVDENAVLQKLAADEAAMRTVADQTLYKVQRAVGLRP